MIDLKNIDWPEIQEKLASFATSDLAREKVRSIQPLAHPQEAIKSFAIIDELKYVLSAGQRPFMESLDLFSLWHSRIKKKSVLTTMQLKDVRSFCLESMALKEVLTPFESSWVQQMKTELMDASYPLSAIDQLMTPQGEIRTDASEKLHSLYTEKNNQSKAVQNILDRLVKVHEMESVLQERIVTNREGRLVLPVKSGMRHSLPGLIHGASQTKQTVYMEPEEVIPLNNRLKQVESEIESEIERLLTEVSHYLSSLSDEFQKNYELMLELDFRFALARMAQFINAVPVRFSSDKIELHNARHPLMALRGEDVIPNTIRLDDNARILLLSGPNAGGKTVLLKSVGLAAHMARCGLLICASEDSCLPFFKNIYVAVGDSQSVEAHLSTFAAHVTILNRATEAKGHENLLLIDEICGSTDPEEGSALARAFIESYAENKVFGVITSHLGPLKMGWEKSRTVMNGSMEYSNRTGKPTYHFVMGVPGQSLAIRTAEKVGVKNELIQKAMEYLSPQTKAHQQTLREAEQLREQLWDVKQQLNRELNEAREAKAKYQEMLEQFRKEKQEKLDRAVKKAEQKLESFIEKVKVDDIFKKHDRINQIKMEIPELVKASPSLATSAIETGEQFEKAYPPGSKVFIPSLHQDGIIQGSVNSKGEVPVLASSMRLLLPWKSLKPAHKPQNPTGQILRRSSNVTVSLNESQRVIDLRGQSVEQAISQLEIQMDQAATHHEDRVKVIHGFGTETLKKAVRNYLSRSVYVKKWTAGSPENGGDGVTWIELQD